MVSRLFADISSNNSEFDALEYRRAGHLIVAIKSSESTDYVNPDHRSWCLHAGMHHIAVIHYHFSRPDLGNSPEAEAEHFLRTALPLAGGRDYLVDDLERACPQGWQHDPAWSRAFDGYVRAHSRFKVIDYASRALLEQSDEWLVAEPKRVWVADWSTGPDYAPKGYEVAMRQFTDGTFGPEPHGLPGVGQCDVNRLGNRIFYKLIAQHRRRLAEPAQQGLTFTSR